MKTKLIKIVIGVVLAIALAIGITFLVKYENSSEYNNQLEELYEDGHIITADEFFEDTRE